MPLSTLVSLFTRKTPLVKATHGRKRSRPARRRLLSLEQLEDRVLLTSGFYVGDGILFVDPERGGPQFNEDVITIDTNITGGVYANLNGNHSESVSYPNGEIKYVIIRPGDGPNIVSQYRVRIEHQCQNYDHE